MVDGIREQLVEEGAAFRKLSGLGGSDAVGAVEELTGRKQATSPGRSPADERAEEHVPVIVIGAGQAGLSVGYHLKRLGVPFTILDAEARVGDAWRRRWDSLRLFTPARYDSLDGMPFPAPATSFPTKDEMGDYLEAYARRFALPVRHRVRVDGLFREGDRYVVTAGESRWTADHVVVAMSSYQQPVIPPFAGELDRGVVQLHAIDYKNPAQLRPGGVLLVGAGNSGADIAMELVRQGRPVFLSGRSTGHVPFRIEGFLGRRVLVRLVLRVLFHRIMSLDTPIGRKARPGFISRGGPLIRVKPSDLAAAGVQRLPRIAGVNDGRPRLEDGQVLDVPNVIWCTGFHPGFSWIRLPVFDSDGEPRHVRGVAADQSGLYFVGLHFIYAASSTMIHGVGRDARYVAERIAARVATGAPLQARLSAGRG